LRRHRIAALGRSGTSRNPNHVGAALVLAYLRKDDLARLFLWFYVPCSVLVLSGLTLALMDMQGTVSPAAWGVVEYLER